jgi:hypothetical protein
VNTFEALPLDFAVEAPQVGLPAGWFDNELSWKDGAVDDRLALMLTAALCSNPEVRQGKRYLVSEEALAVRLLALRAAGAPVGFHRLDAGELKAKARALAARLGADSELAQVIEYVCNRFDEQSAAPAFVELELLDGRGYRDLSEGLPADYVTNCGAGSRLLLYAALLSAAKPNLCNTHVEPLVLLALYGAGAGFRLSKRQYNRLTRIAHSYRSHMKFRPQWHNHQAANYILRKAHERAQADGLFAKTPAE